MANLNLQSTLGFPYGHIRVATASVTNTLIDASGERVAWVFQIPNDCGATLTITTLLFRYGARTGTPPVYRISLQAIGGDGFPDGTVLGGGSPASATFTPPADTTWNGTVQAITLDNSYAAAPGELIAIVIDYSSGTISGSHNSSFTVGSSGDWTDAVRPNFPYPSSYNGSAWAFISATNPYYGFRTATKSYGFPQLNIATTTLGTNGHRACLKYTHPASAGGPYQIAGFDFVGQTPASGANTWKFAMWNAAGTALVTGATLDSDYGCFPGNSGRLMRVWFTDATLPTLLPGVPYYLGIERTNASCILNHVTMASAQDIGTCGGDPGICLATWDGSSWTDTTTARPDVQPIFASQTFSARSRFQLGI